MIRNTDCSIYSEGETIDAKKVSDLKNRVAIVNDSSDALLVSIHQNYYPDNRYSGAQVFYSAKEGSAELANSLQSLFIQTLNPGSNRKAKKATGIYLMDKIKKPGVLIECGFISNHSDITKLTDSAYQRALCTVMLSAYLQFININTSSTSMQL